jgi:hypothetical protein
MRSSIHKEKKVKKLFETMIAIVFVFALTASLATVATAAGDVKQGTVAIVTPKKITVGQQINVRPGPYATTNCFGVPAFAPAAAVTETVPSISARPKEKPNITIFSGLPAQHFARADPGP